MRPQILPLKFGLPSGGAEPMIGAHNRHIFQLLNQWPHWPFQQWVLWGEPNSGKSTMVRHLMKERVRGEFLTPQRALEKRPHAWLEEPAQLFVLKGYDQGYPEEWLFHFYNAIQESRVYAVYIGHTPPAQSQLQLPDLVSRLTTLTSMQVLAPDDIFLQTLIIEKLKEKGLTLTQELAAYILKRTERTCTHMLKLAEEIHYWALLQQKDATLSVIRKALNMTDEEESSDHDVPPTTHKISRLANNTLALPLFRI